MVLLDGLNKWPYYKASGLIILDHLRLGQFIRSWDMLSCYQTDLVILVQTRLSAQVSLSFSPWHCPARACPHPAQSTVSTMVCTCLAQSVKQSICSRSYNISPEGKFRNTKFFHIYFFSTPLVWFLPDGFVQWKDRRLSHNIFKYYYH